MTQQVREFDKSVPLGDKCPEPLNLQQTIRRGERKKAERIKRATLQAERDQLQVDPVQLARVRGALNGYNKGTWTTRNH